MALNGHSLVQSLPTLNWADFASSSTEAALTKYHRLQKCINNRHLFSIVLEAATFRIKMLAHLVSGGSSLSG